MVSAAAGFHTDSARRQVRRPDGEACEAQLLKVHRSPPRISGAHDNNFLCQVHTDGSNLIHEFPFSGSD
jgi:hypothetical protein